MDLEFTFTLTELVTKDSGRMIYNTVMAKKAGPMVLCMKESTLPVKSMEEECTAGTMDLDTMENGKKTK